MLQQNAGSGVSALTVLNPSGVEFTLNRQDPLADTIWGCGSAGGWQL